MKKFFFLYLVPFFAGFTQSKVGVDHNGSFTLLNFTRLKKKVKRNIYRSPTFVSEKLLQQRDELIWQMYLFIYIQDHLLLQMCLPTILSPSFLLFLSSIVRRDVRNKGCHIACSPAVLKASTISPRLFHTSSNFAASAVYIIKDVSAFFRRKKHVTSIFHLPK